MKKLILFILIMMTASFQQSVAEEAQDAKADSLYEQARAEFSTIFKTREAKSYEQLAQDYLDLRDRYPDSLSVSGQASNQAGQMYLRAGDYENAIACYQWTYERFEHAKDVPNRLHSLEQGRCFGNYVGALFELGLSHYLSGEEQAALILFKKSLPLASEQVALVFLENQVHEKFFIPYFSKRIPSLSHGWEKWRTPTNEPFKIFSFNMKPAAEFIIALLKNELPEEKK